MAKKPDPDRCNAQQTRYLTQRIDRCYYPRLSKEVDPPEVAAARRVIAKFESKQSKLRDVASTAWAKRVKKARDVVLFGKPKDALRAVEQLEAACKGRI